MIEEALKVNACHSLRFILAKFAQHKDIPKKDLTNIVFANELVDLSNNNIRYVTFWYFRKRITEGDLKCPNNRANLSNLCALYGLHTLYQNSNNCFESGYFQPGVEYASLMLDALKQLLKLLRPQIINIVEGSFANPDFKDMDHYLQSAVGNYYGDIFETHLKWA